MFVLFAVLVAVAIAAPQPQFGFGFPGGFGGTYRCFLAMFCGGTTAFAWFLCGLLTTNIYTSFIRHMRFVEPKTMPDQSLSWWTALFEYNKLIDWNPLQVAHMAVMVDMEAAMAAAMAAMAVCYTPRARANLSAWIGFQWNILLFLSFTQRSWRIWRLWRLWWPWPSSPSPRISINPGIYRIISPMSYECFFLIENKNNFWTNAKNFHAIHYLFEIWISSI